MKQRVRQELAFSSARVGGGYTIANLFRLRPIHADALTLDAAIGHHPFLLEYRYEVPDAADTPYNPELPIQTSARSWAILGRETALPPSAEFPLKR
jgi:hypothetical protein